MRAAKLVRVVRADMDCGQTHTNSTKSFRSLPGRNEAFVFHGQVSGETIVAAAGTRRQRKSEAGAEMTF